MVVFDDLVKPDHFFSNVVTRACNLRSNHEMEKSFTSMGYDSL